MMRAARKSRKTESIFWAECTLGAASTVLAALTIVVPDWIEAAFGVDPDHGNGVFEWLLTITLMSIAVSLFAAARQRRRALRPGWSRTCP
jgi:hypothetical protein